MNDISKVDVVIQAIEDIHKIQVAVIKAHEYPEPDALMKELYGNDYGSGEGVK